MEIQSALPIAVDSSLRPSALSTEAASALALMTCGVPADIRSQHQV